MSDYEGAFTAILLVLGIIGFVGAVYISFIMAGIIIAMFAFPDTILVFVFFFIICLKALLG